MATGLSVFFLFVPNTIQKHTNTKSGRRYKPPLNVIDDYKKKKTSFTRFGKPPSHYTSLDSRLVKCLSLQKSPLAYHTGFYALKDSVLTKPSFLLLGNNPNSVLSEYLAPSCKEPRIHWFSVFNTGSILL